MTILNTPGRGEIGAGLARDHYRAETPDLLDRWAPVSDWLWARRAAGLLAQPRVSGSAPGRQAAGQDAQGLELSGLDFAARDHLSLAAHTEVREAAAEALERFGPHAAGPLPGNGQSSLSVALETCLAEFLAYEHATIFANGWAAGLGVLRTLLTAQDRVVLAGSAWLCMRQAAELATPNISTLSEIKPAALESLLAGLRARDTQAGILVMTEALDTGQRQVAQVGALQDVCDAYRATLLVDISRDLAATGATGRGVLEDQDMLGTVDVVTGSMARSLASPAGFVASNHPALRDALRHVGTGQGCSSALPPVQAAAALTALKLAAGTDGDVRRARIGRSLKRLQTALKQRGFSPLPTCGAEISVAAGDLAQARRRQAAAQSLGAVIGLEEGDGGACEWRLQIQAAHELSDCVALAERMMQACVLADRAHWTPPVLGA